MKLHSNVSMSLIFFPLRTSCSIFHRWFRKVTMLGIEYTGVSKKITNFTRCFLLSFFRIEKLTSVFFKSVKETLLRFQKQKKRKIHLEIYNNNKKWFMMHNFLTSIRYFWFWYLLEIFVKTRTKRWNIKNRKIKKWLIFTANFLSVIMYVCENFWKISIK